MLGTVGCACAAAMPADIKRRLNTRHMEAEYTALRPHAATLKSLWSSGYPAAHLRRHIREYPLVQSPHGSRIRMRKTCIESQPRRNTHQAHGLPAIHFAFAPAISLGRKHHPTQSFRVSNPVVEQKRRWIELQHGFSVSENRAVGWGANGGIERVYCGPMVRLQILLIILASHAFAGARIFIVTRYGRRRRRQ